MEPIFKKCFFVPPKKKFFGFELENNFKCLQLIFKDYKYNDIFNKKNINSFFQFFAYFIGFSFLLKIHHTIFFHKYELSTCFVGNRRNYYIVMLQLIEIGYVLLISIVVCV